MTIILTVNDSFHTFLEGDTNYYLTNKRNFNKVNNEINKSSDTISNVCSTPNTIEGALN